MKQSNERRILVCGTMKLSIGNEIVTVIAGDQVVEIVRSEPLNSK